MANTQSKLFHAIVGLGIGAAGCGGDTGLPVPGLRGASAGAADASASTKPTTDASRDAAMSKPPLPDARSQHDAFVVLRPDAGFDAGAARDAAHDVSQPPPPPPVK